MYNNFIQTKSCFQRIKAIIVRLIQVYAANIVFSLKIRLFLHNIVINYLLSFFNASFSSL